MKSKRRGNKLVLMLNKRIIANLNHREMFNVRGGDDLKDNLLKKTDPKVCEVEKTDPAICHEPDRTVPMDFGIPTH